VRNSTAQAPPFLWARSAGGGSTDTANGIATDAEGNVYLTGRLRPPANIGTTSITTGEAFLAKYDSNGTPLWVRAGFGVSRPSEIIEQVNALARDPTGNLYITGQYQGPSGWQVFLTKFDGAGRQLWFKPTTGWPTDYPRQGQHVAIDHEGNVLAVGNFKYQMDFGGLSLGGGDQGDGFIGKYDPSGKVLWARRIGGTGPDFANGIAVDQKGDLLVVGEFYQRADFGGTALQGTTGALNGFLTKLKANGETVWAQAIKPANNGSYIYAYGIAVDGEGNSYVGVLYNMHASRTLAVGVAKFAPEGALVWNMKTSAFAAPEVGEPLSAIIPPISISADTVGNSYLASSFSGKIQIANLQLTSSGQFDMLLMKFGPGGDFGWVKTAGYIFDDAPRAISLAPDGSLYLAGSFHASS
jgi:uncharacterized protein (AIM24 family)